MTEITGKIHVPLDQYGYLEKEYSFVGGNEDGFNKKMLEDYSLITELFKKSKYEYWHMSGTNWRKKDGKHEYQRDGKWIGKE